ncbi:hypothetical protein Y699_03829 [Aspergillus fumigatus Z5]|nr:hypothetical protein Y699_03829 [Aspergillus fumigatus Z5]
MALLSSKTLIQAHALFLFVLAVYLTRSPSTVTNSDVVFMIGEVLQIDAAPSFSRPQSPFALCGILLIADALVDLIVIAKIPLSRPDAWGVGAGAARTTGGYGSGEATSGLDQLKNRVVFTYGFMEMMFWLWIFITLREERQEIAARFVEREE